MLNCVAYNAITKGVIETEKHLGHSFKKLHFLLEQAVNQRLLELDLTSAQGHVIGFLRQSKEPPCAKDLENAHGLSHATVSGILSRMEAKGFIGQEPDPRDRRVKRLYLRERGLACSQSIWRHIGEIERVMTADFTPGELDQFRGYLSRAISNLDQHVRESHSNREE